MATKNRVAVTGGQQLPAEKGNCVLCAVAAERACQRCGDFYCSKDCQLQDWQRHRYICFPLPALVYPKSFSVHTSESTEELSVEGACFLDKPDKVVVESGRPSPLPHIIPELKCDAATSRVGPSTSNAGSGAVPKKAPVAATALSTHASSSIVSNINTSNAKNKNISPPKAIVPPTNSLVVVSGFRSPNRCYIRDASETADRAFGQMCEKVNAMGHEMPRMVKARTHMYCLARYNGMFQRATVLTTAGNQSARLLLFDLGIVKSRNLSEMREISEELLSLPCFSVQVQLKDVPNYSITEDVIEFLSQFTGDKFVAVYTKAPGAINVELLHPETKCSLNAQICKFCANKKVFESPHFANKNKNEKDPSKPQNPKAGLGSTKPNTSQETTPVSNNKKTTPTELGLRIEAGLGGSVPIKDQECTKLEEEEKIIETKETKPTEPHDKPTDQDANKLNGAQGPKNTTENAKPSTSTSEIENLNLSQEPKAGETLLDKDKNIPAPSALSRKTDQTVREFLTQCLASRPSLPGSDTKNEKASLSLKPLEQTYVQMPPLLDTTNANTPLYIKPIEQLDVQKPLSGTTNEKAPLSVKPKEQPDVQTPLTQSKPQVNGIVNSLLIPPFEMRRFSIPNRDGIDVYVVDVSKISRGIFGAFDSSFACEFSTLHSRLSEITNSEPYKPALKEFVLARYEGSWYRGRVEQVKATQNQTEYRVMYLDYTNAADVTEQDIRQYPLDFTTPCMTNICMIDGFPHKPTPAQVAYLADTVKVSQLLHVDGVMYLNIQSDVAIIKCRDLIDKLMSL